MENKVAAKLTYKIEVLMSPLKDGNQDIHTNKVNEFAKEYHFMPSANEMNIHGFGKFIINAVTYVDGGNIITIFNTLIAEQI